MEGYSHQHTKRLNQNPTVWTAFKRAHYLSLRILDGNRTSTGNLPLPSLNKFLTEFLFECVELFFELNDVTVALLNVYRSANKIIQDKQFSIMQPDKEISLPSDLWGT